MKTETIRNTGAMAMIILVFILIGLENHVYAEKPMAKKEKYAVLIMAEGNGTTTPNEGFLAEEGRGATEITAIPDSGYEFNGWTVIAGEAVFTNAAAATTRVSVSTASIIQANFIASVSLPTLITNTDILQIREGCKGTIRVKLSEKPLSPINVSATIAGDKDLKIQGRNKLIFTSGNWNKWQLLMLSAERDDDGENGDGILTLTSENDSECSVWVQEEDMGINTRIDLNRGLVHYYPFDGSGRDCVAEFHARPVAEKYVPGRIGQAVDLTGAAYMTAGDRNTFRLLHNGSSFSVSVWVKRQVKVSKAEYFFCTTRGADVPGFAIYLYRDNLVSFIGRKSQSKGYFMRVDAPGAMPVDGNWHLVTVTMDPMDKLQGYKLYVDGECLQAGAVKDGLDDLPQDHSLVIGDANVGRGSDIEGLLDDLRIYNRALAPGEARKLFLNRNRGNGGLGKSVEVFGIVSKNNSLVKIDLETGETTMIGSLGLNIGMSALAFYGDKLIGCSFVSPTQEQLQADSTLRRRLYLYEIDAETAEVSVLRIFPVPNLEIGAGLEAVPQENAFYWSTNRSINKLDMVTGNVTKVMDLKQGTYCLASHSDGYLLGVTLRRNELIEIHPKSQRVLRAKKLNLDASVPCMATTPGNGLLIVTFRGSIYYMKNKNTQPTLLVQTKMMPWGIACRRVRTPAILSGR